MGGADFDQSSEHFADENGFLFQIAENQFRNVFDSTGDIELGS
jgi:hypothetical protein